MFLIRMKQKDLFIEWTLLNQHSFFSCAFFFFFFFYLDSFFQTISNEPAFVETEKKNTPVEK